MPPKGVRLRPAARLARPAAAAGEPPARKRRRGSTPPGQQDPQEVGWIDAKEIVEGKIPLQSLVKVELYHQDELGMLFGILKGLHEDAEGKWMGIAVQGTNLQSLRQWRLTTQEDLYVMRGLVPPAERLNMEGVGYGVKVKPMDRADESWATNCIEEVAAQAKGDVETQGLQRVAERFGFPGGQVAEQAEAPPHPPGEVEGGEKEKKKKKKKSGSTKVKEMVARAKWSAKGTPLDVEFRRPIKISLRGRQEESSGSSSSSSSSKSSSLSTDHRLRRVAQKLPGYLCRKAAKEASTVLAQSTAGERIDNLGVFRRYYRQILVPKGASRPLLREMQTLATALDSLIAGNVLTTLDVLAQRLKSLEMLAGGTPADLANQVEIVPKELSGLTSQSEGRLAQKEFTQENRLQKALKGHQGKGKPPSEPYHPKGYPGKGGKTGTKGPKGGKEKREDSKIMKVD